VGFAPPGCGPWSEQKNSVKFLHLHFIDHLDHNALYQNEFIIEYISAAEEKRGSANSSDNFVYAVTRKIYISSRTLQKLWAKGIVLLPYNQATVGEMTS